MSAVQKHRLIVTTRNLIGVLCVGIGYYFFVRFVKWSIPCAFYALSGIYCPGCGITRMCMALARLDIAAAFSYNALVMCLLPVCIPYGIYRWVAYVSNGKTDFRRWEQVLLIVTALLTISFWVLRNTADFSWLAP